MRKIGLLVALTACLTAASCSWIQESMGEREAQRILEATGIRGGLIVHLGSGDGRITAGLFRHESFQVQGLDSDVEDVSESRDYLRDRGLYGQVSTDLLQGSRLPYIDNLVNLVVSEDLGAVPMAEVMRVLCPNGVAYIKEGEEWIKTVKPRPAEIDDWTHYWHDATGNAVAQDSTVGPPRGFQWIGSPTWARHHDHMSSMTALVSAGGRIFYIIDEGPRESILLPAEWFLVARDAFNGTILWKRSISLWNTHLWPLKSGPAQLPHRLVAIGDRVYVTLGIDAPVTALDAATGETLLTYEGTEDTEEIIASDGELILLINRAGTKWNDYRPTDTFVWANMSVANTEFAWDGQDRSIRVVQGTTGELLWETNQPVVPLSLSADANGVYFHDGEKIICRDRKSGEEQWKSQPVETRSPVQTSFGPRLVVYKDVVLFSTGKYSMSSYSAETGELLWTAEQARSGHQSPEDLLVVDDLVWSGAIAVPRFSGVFTGRDPWTGEVKSEFPPDVEIDWFHQRCYPSKATNRYLLPSRTGIEFVDFRAQQWTTNHWVRGSCVYGIMPANGLVYAPPHSCACFLEAQLNGFSALAPQTEYAALKVTAENRLEQGPAYGEAVDRMLARETDWPAYRHDSARSGFTTASVPASLGRKWQAQLGGRLGGLTMAQNRVFATSIDTHTVFALSADTGDILWSYTAGGRVDSPPTFNKGTILFGSADGGVYCLRASDGNLIWRFRVAPAELKLLAYEQLESVWPVHGSVLVENDVAYCLAGRSMFLDGGIRLVRLDPETGRKLSETILDEKDPVSGENLQSKVSGLNMPVASPDILSSDGRLIYMRSQSFDFAGVRQEVGPKKVVEQEGEGSHLFSMVGFLDDSWFHRSYFMYGRGAESGWPGWFRAGRYIPAGRLLVFDDDSVYGYGRQPEFFAQSSVLEYLLFSAEKKANPEEIQRVQEATNRMDKKAEKRNASAADWGLRKEFPFSDRTAVNFQWKHDNPPFSVRAMVLADDTLFIAGPPDVVNEEEVYLHPDDPELLEKVQQQRAAVAGQMGSLLWAVSASDGSKLAEYRLESLPVFDGMAASEGQLYLAMKDGSVLCLAGD